MALHFQPILFQLNTLKKSFLPFINLNSTNVNGSFPFSSKTKTKSSINKAPQASLTSKSHPDARPLAHFPPDIWANQIGSIQFNQSEFERYDRQVKVYSERIMDMLLAPANDYVEKILLIDLLYRLGVSYHFEDVIEEKLNHIFHVHPQILEGKGYDLYTTATVFRVFRQHGFKMTSDVFNKFKDSDGKFKSSLGKDPKAMLSLYEAAYLSLPEEEILDEALSFSKANLDSLAIDSSLPDHYRRHIINALDQPFHYGIPRLENRKFIGLYEADESRNETLLLFAKLDFNRVQLLHQQEMSIFSEWFQDLKLASQIPYARARMVENFFAATAVTFEPDYAQSRVISSKVISLVAILDDTIDAYATIDEIHLLADAIERWDISCIDQLPDYMKLIYKLFLNTYSEIEVELKLEGKGYTAKFGKEAFQELARAYYLEAIWRHAEGKVPSLDEYIENGSVSSMVPLIPITGLLGAENIKGTKEFEWLMNKPKINFFCGALIRIINDIATYKAESKRGNVISSVNCYMEQFGDPEEEAIENLHKMEFEIWKQINNEIMMPRQIPLNVLMLPVHTLRLIFVGNAKGDRYSDPQGFKKFVQEMLIHPISI